MRPSGTETEGVAGRGGFQGDSFLFPFFPLPLPSALCLCSFLLAIKTNICLTITVEITEGKKDGKGYSADRRPQRGDVQRDTEPEG